MSTQLDRCLSISVLREVKLMKQHLMGEPYLDWKPKKAFLFVCFILSKLKCDYITFFFR